MLQLIKTTSENPDFVALTKLLDDELLEEYGEAEVFYSQFNKTVNIRHVIIACLDDVAVGCGAIKPYDADTAEVKRIFVKDEFRGRKIAKTIVEHLEQWSKDEGYSYCILETGTRQLSAIALYKQLGYEIIPNYDQYSGMKTSICMKKYLG
jgi:GNAT superfamily N-acetyltransferase